MSGAPAEPHEQQQGRQSDRRRLSPATKRGIRLGVEIVAVAVATASLSALLVRLSGTALQLPPPWGESVRVMMPLMGVAVFTFCRHGTSLAREWRKGEVKRAFADRRAAAKPAERKKLPGAKEAEKQADMQSRVVTSAFAVILLASALILFLNYESLRGWTAYKFTIPSNYSSEAPWGWEEWVGGEFPTDPKAIPAALEQLHEKAPHYVDLRQNIMYLPVTLPEDVRELVTLRDGSSFEGSFEKGLRDILDNDPMTLIDWLRESPTTRVEMQSTQRAFFWRHALILSMVAAAAGVVFAPTQSLARAGAEALIS